MLDRHGFILYFNDQISRLHECQEMAPAWPRAQAPTRQTRMPAEAGRSMILMGR